ncbi:MAG: bacteriochlorophyll 4-vinyl reductase [Burkholderiales bacterium]|jgi:divinyl protochlorophyllide a 8-vinyl-reductase|nr:bacteriochlorophyll 4-vinyl reductase [Burkholderiales bacterium]
MSAALHARIGPNAITRLAEALGAGPGPEAVRAVFGRAGLVAYLDAPPTRMVPEADVQQLHRSLRACLDAPLADRIARDAGRRTADYLLAHRIPRAFQALLRVLPARPAARLLLHAIGRHAWTFAGSGRFTVTRGATVRFSIEDNPLCRGEHADAPICGFFAATFERLFGALIDPAARVDEIACEATGAAACVFELRGPRFDRR